MGKEQTEDDLDFSNMRVNNLTRLISLGSQLVSLSGATAIRYKDGLHFLRGILFDSKGVRCVVGSGDGESVSEIPLRECMDVVPREK